MRYLITGESKRIDKRQTDRLTEINRENLNCEWLFREESSLQVLHKTNDNIFYSTTEV